MAEVKTSKIKLGNRVKLIRQHFSLKQREMAANLGLKQGSYSRIELGIVGMSLSVLQVLVEKYDINLNWLLTGRGEMLLSENKIPNNLEQEYLKVIKENSELKSKIISLLEQPVEV